MILFAVFMFFVLSYAAQAIFPDIRRKNIALLVSSLIFYAWAGPWLLLLLCGMTFICWVGALCVEDRTDPREKKICLTVTAVLVLGLLGGYFGGKVDSLVVWLSATVASMPGLLFILGSISPAVVHDCRTVVACPYDGLREAALRIVFLEYLA